MVVIQGKLDGIKTKYAEINSMSDNVLKTLERVLSLSTKLQHTHEELRSWLEKAEAEISAFADQEPVGEQLIQAQSRQKVRVSSIKVKNAMQIVFLLKGIIPNVMPNKSCCLICAFCVSQSCPGLVEGDQRPKTCDGQAE